VLKVPFISPELSKSVYNFAMSSAKLLIFPTKQAETVLTDRGISSTDQIVQALTKAIIEHRLQPGEKLKEQHIADQFGVSRTLVRQALYQLSQRAARLWLHLLAKRRVRCLRCA
jgi:Bacterial regulatory proteins, gntR family